MQWQDRLRAIRQRRGFTLAQLADRLGVTEGAVSHWETRRRLPSIEQVERIAMALEVDVAELVAGDPAFATSDQELAALALFRKIPETQRELALRLLEQLTTPKD
jgi:transcriptional regulator with XRE-family HTH domain